MAFHVACPITSKRICFCTLGFPQKLQSEKGRKIFLEEISRIEEFLSDPWSIRVKEKDTVQVVVPRIVPPPPPPPPVVEGFGGGDGYVGGGDGEEFLSVQSKRAALQKRAIEASLAAEDYARKFETGGLVDVSGETVQNVVGEDQGSSTVKVMCRMCFYGENEGSERASRMLACKICSKKYHRGCLKSWAQYRDLFHLSSWVCPSCRTCEVCRRTGDPTKFMFCKRCDGAYHCYCQHPPHKNVANGPYLCPKHTRCHSCESTVPGNGPSTRWFLGYTCCDACGRLFVKGNYCPVCLKVYRDSESTPMVCCDVCQRWVHCQCDGISDDKYLQFQADGNLYYKCAACRGDCYQVRDPDDAIQELWRRRDKADRGQIVSLRAAAGLPSQEDKFSDSQYSDDEEYSPIILKHEYGHSLKFSLKGSVHKATKNTKEYGKKSSNKKYGKKKGHQVTSISKREAHQSFERLQDRQSFEMSLNDDTRSYRNEGQEMVSHPITINPDNIRETCSINQAGIVKHNFIDKVGVNNEVRTPTVIQIKSSKLHGSNTVEGTRASKSETVKGTKLVIHLGARNRNITNSPRSETSSCHREHDLTASNGGSEDTSQQKANDKKHMVKRHDGIASYFDGERLDNANANLLKGSKYRGQESGFIKLGKVKSGVSDLNPQIRRGDFTKGYESTAVGKTHALLERSTEGSTTMIEPVTEAPTFGNDQVLLRRHSKGTPNIRSESHDNNANNTSGLDLVPKEPKPLLKLKFKNPYFDNRSSWVPHGEEERSSIKGQRSKRKRPSPSLEKSQAREDEDGTQVHQDNPINEVMEANWILKKLGKDAIGKRVEVHQPSDNSWHKGVITDVIEGKSALAAVRLDDGKDRTLDLGKQVVRFISQKQKRSKP